MSMSAPIDLQPLTQLELGQPVGQCRAIPINLGPGEPPAVVVCYGSDYDDDPYHEMFFFPKDTLKLIVFEVATGRVRWRRALHRGVVPGSWFFPMYTADLDGDGVDEVFIVNNNDPVHPFAHSQYRLEQLDGRTGETRAQWRWPAPNAWVHVGHAFRNFILGGRVHGLPMLVTAQGTYDGMRLQGWGTGMKEAWEVEIAPGSEGARGSHMCPVVDLDGDGVDELMWGERCLKLDTGRELFCCDQETWRGHSDVIQPVWDEAAQRWLIYTCRESHVDLSPRVAVYDARGQRVWGAVEEGHIDMGWVARLGQDGRKIGMGIRIGHKTSGAGGHAHLAREEFAFDAITGRPETLPFSTYETRIVDLDGDGRHEIVYGAYKGNGEVVDAAGRRVGNIGGKAVLVAKFADHPGEQILGASDSGRLTVWVDRNAKDTAAAQARYSNPCYTANVRHFATGANHGVLGGI